MTQKITMIVGEPCVGKSLLMKTLMVGDVWKFMPRTFKLVPLHIDDAKTAAILGRYDESGHKYPGTDRMSMAAQPLVLQVLPKLAPLSVIFEGDRLGNASMTDSILAMMPDADLAVLFMSLSEIDLAVRRAAERPDQNQTFWKSRKTKIQNLRQHCFDLKEKPEFKGMDSRFHVGIWPSYAKQDIEKMAAWIRKERM